MSSLLKLRKVAGDADAATKSASAFDLDDMPQQFKCPICFEIPPSEIFQCPNGHTICKSCNDKNTNRKCAQCRTSMTSKGPLIRNRVLEDLLDQVLIACPFRKNGCLETFSRQMDRKEHEDNCVKDGNCVQFCKYLGDYDDEITCDYWTRTTKPAQAVEHLMEHHGASWCDPTRVSLPTFESEVRKFLQLETPSPIAVYSPIYLNDFGGHFLIVWLLNQKDRTVSFVGIRIDKAQEQLENEIEFRIKSENAMMPELKWRVPVIPVLNSGKVLQKPPFRVSVEVLEEHYLRQEDGALAFSVSIKQINKQRGGDSKKKRKRDDSSDNSNNS